MAYMAGLFLHDFPPKDIVISSFSDIFRVSPFLRTHFFFEVLHDLIHILLKPGVQMGAARSLHVTS